jgi:predicted nuclease of predicted toxin-antitoxin system
MIVADEGLNGNLVKALRGDGFKIDWVKETNAGMNDEDIIALVRQNSQILITEDKDFGEWIFAHQLSGLTVIFLRYDKEDYDTILSFLKSALKTLETSGDNEFITINKNKIRRRRI